jgi:hypothetical protein
MTNFIFFEQFSKKYFEKLFFHEKPQPIPKLIFEILPCPWMTWQFLDLVESFVPSFRSTLKGGGQTEVLEKAHREEATASLRGWNSLQPASPWASNSSKPHCLF